MASLCQFPGNMLLYRNKAEAEPKLALKMFTCLRDFEFMTQKNKHTHKYTYTHYDWPHIVFSFIELPNRTANALDKCNSDVKNLLRFEIYWNLFAVSYWLGGGQAWLVEVSRGGERENLATHLPIRDLSIYVSSEANRKHFLCLASNLWPVTGPRNCPPTPSS